MPSYWILLCVCCFLTQDGTYEIHSHEDFYFFHCCCFGQFCSHNECSQWGFFRIGFFEKALSIWGSLASASNTSGAPVDPSLDRPYKGRLIGKLRSVKQSKDSPNVGVSFVISGTIYAVDDKLLYMDKFTYDGGLSGLLPEQKNPLLYHCIDTVTDTFSLLWKVPWIFKEKNHSRFRKISSWKEMVLNCQ